MTRLRRARAASRAAIQRQNDIKKNINIRDPFMIGNQKFGAESYGGDPNLMPSPGSYQRESDYYARYKGIMNLNEALGPLNSHKGPYRN